MIKLDERGHQCPIPVINTKKVIETAPKGEQILVITDNEIAVQNLNKLANQKGCTFSFEKKANDHFESLFTVNSDPVATPEENEVIVCEDCAPTGNGTAVVIASPYMGHGDDDLGRLLLKGFIFALTQVTPLPKNIIFYNGGAQVSSEGSPSIEDLKNLEGAGVKIITCGTCLNHYGLTDKLAVGEIANMYDIVETISKAAKVIRP